MVLLFVEQTRLDGLVAHQTRDSVAFFPAVNASGGQLDDLGLGLSDRGDGGRAVGLDRQDMGLGHLDFRLGLPERGLGLVAAPLKLRCVDFGEEIALLDNTADIHPLTDQVAGNLGIQAGLFEGENRAGLGHDPAQPALPGRGHDDANRRHRGTGVVRSQAGSGQGWLAAAP